MQASTSQTASSMWSISDGWDKRPRPQNESLLYKFEHGRARSAAPRPRKVVVRKAYAPFGQHTMGVGERVHPLLWDGNPSTTFSVGSPGKQDKAAFPGAITIPTRVYRRRIYQIVIFLAGTLCRLRRSDASCSYKSV